MAEFLRTYPVDSEKPVQYVCYHPIAEKHLKQGRDAEPSCLAVDYEYENPILEIFHALGWQGGTIHQAVAEILRLRSIAEGPKPGTTESSLLREMQQLNDLMGGKK